MKGCRVCRYLGECDIIVDIQEMSGRHALFPYCDIVERS